MENIVKQGNRVFVAGRAGELTDKADKKTFELLEKIFAYKGPQRKVLKQFGIGNQNFKESYLKVIDGYVMTDIENENKALWESCMYKLVIEKENVSLKLNLTPSGVIKGLFGFIKKNIVETKILSNLNKAIETADLRYLSYCSIVKKSIEKREISEEEFLKAYENVVYVTYVYELLFNYNEKDNFSHEKLKEFVRENDYLLKYDESYAEFRLKPKGGFSFGGYRGEKISGEKIKLIPSEIPTPKLDVEKKYIAEKKLQCLKNNMRLKTNVLLYFLSTKAS